VSVIDHLDSLRSNGARAGLRKIHQVDAATIARFVAQEQNLVIVGQPVTPMITERSQIYGLCRAGTRGQEYQIVEVKAGETHHPLGIRRQRI
jgi:hypothetical protein